MRAKARTAELEQENQRLRHLVAELDELPREKRRRGCSDLKSVSDLNTIINKGIRAIPAGEGGDYLDLFLLEKERERLAQETAWMKKRRMRIARKVADIDKAMAKHEEKALQSKALSSGQLSHCKQSPETPSEKGPGWNRLPIGY